MVLEIKKHDFENTQGKILCFNIFLVLFILLYEMIWRRKYFRFEAESEKSRSQIWV